MKKTKIHNNSSEQARKLMHLSRQTGRQWSVRGIPVRAGDSINISLLIGPNRESGIKRIGKFVAPTFLSGAFASRPNRGVVDAPKRDATLINLGLTATGGVLTSLSRHQKTQLYLHAYDKVGNQIQSRTQTVRRKHTEVTLSYKVTKDGLVDFSATGGHTITVNSVDSYLYNEATPPVIRPGDDQPTPQCTCVVQTWYQDGVPIYSEVLGCSGCGGSGGGEVADDNQPGTVSGPHTDPTPEPFDESPTPIPGKKYSQGRACEVYKAMWERSKAANKEQLALLTDKDIIYVPDHSNTVNSAQTIYTYFPNTQNPNGPRYIVIGGEKYSVLATIHTHPIGSQWQNNPSQADFTLSDFLNVPSFIIADEGIHKYNGNGGHSVSHNIFPRGFIMDDCNTAINLYGHI